MTPEVLRLIDVLRDPVLIVARDGTILAANRAFRSTFGEKHARLADAADVPARELEAFLDACWRTSAPVPGRLRMRYGGGAEPFRCDGARLVSAGDACILLDFAPARHTLRRFILLNEKIAELNAEIDRRRATEVALEDRARRLAEADREKDEFLAQLGHELRNPLAAIRTTLTVLGRDAMPLERALPVLERQSRVMTRLLDDLLDVARLTRGQVTLDRELVSLQAVLRQALETAEPALAASRQTLDVRMPPDAEPLVVDGDPPRLAQAFGNLLHNASKFGRLGGTVRVALERTGGTARLTLEDEGIGFDPADADRIFAPLTQRAAGTGHRHGLGLGLTLARRVFALHHGTIFARSAGPGRGAQFVVELPLARAAGPSGPADAAPGTADAGEGRMRVLVVDDNVDAADATTLLLRPHGFDARCVYDGAAALREALAFRPDAILLDIQLPDIDGFTVARTLRANPALRQPFIIALTGFGESVSAELGAAGVNAHLVKPVEVEELLAALRARPHSSC